MGIDKFYQRGVFPALSVGGLEYVNGIYPTAGKTWFVSPKSGNNSNGLNWKNAFTTLAAAIAANNADVNTYADVGGVKFYKMNRIYVDGYNYAEALTAFPNHCEMIGVGAAPARIQGSTIIADATMAQVCHIYNMQFRNITDSATVYLPYGSQGVEFHNCIFNGNCVATPTVGLQVGSACYSLIVDHCQFWGAPDAICGIQFDGPYTTTSMIIDCFISAVTYGIYFANPMVSSYQVLIKGNTICRTDGYYNIQLVNGIYQADPNSRSDVMIVENWISAATPFTGNKANNTINNHVVVAGNGYLVTEETP